MSAEKEKGKGTDIRIDTWLAIRAKARKDARKNGWPSEPTRKEGWTDEAWKIYSDEYKGEMHAIDQGF